MRVSYHYHCTNRQNVQTNHQFGRDKIWAASFGLLQTTLVAPKYINPSLTVLQLGGNTKQIAQQCLELWNVSKCCLKRTFVSMSETFPCYFLVDIFTAFILSLLEMALSLNCIQNKYLGTFLIQLVKVVFSVRISDVEFFVGIRRYQDEKCSPLHTAYS